MSPAAFTGPRAKAFYKQRPPHAVRTGRAEAQGRREKPATGEAPRGHSESRTNPGKPRNQATARPPSPGPASPQKRNGRPRPCQTGLLRGLVRERARVTALVLQFTWEGVDFLIDGQKLITAFQSLHRSWNSTPAFGPDRRRQNRSGPDTIWPNNAVFNRNSVAVETRSY